ncbi:MAG: tRNA-dihydrouridine synthase family protein [Treponema sp.]|nr:tRNA-dihydrouridine synthase family protein [Treponema sp.]
MCRLILAPMATLSHEAFRMAVEEFGGADEYFTEMIHAPSLITMGPYEKYYLLDGPVPEKIVWQLTGTNAESLADAARIVAEKDGIGIDLNMGCSAPQIYKTGAGISWMLKPVSETSRMVSAVKKVLDEYQDKSGIHKRLSVKCRLGADDFKDDDFFSFCDMLVDNGVECITLHPRTIKEKLRGLPRYEYAERLALRHPEIDVYVNGEIKDVQSAKRAVEKVPHAKGLMVARMAAQKPWIFAQLRHGLDGSGPDSLTVDAKKLALDFIQDIQERQPKEFYRTRIQRFFSYYCDNFSFGHYFKMQLLNYHSIEECIEKINSYFEKCPDDMFIKVY